MADGIRRVQHFGIDISDEIGAGARILKALRDADVNLVAFWGYPMGPGKARLELIPQDADGFIAAAKAAGIDVGEAEPVFYITGDDRSGAVAELLERLAASHVSIGAAEAVADGRGGFGCVLYVAGADVQRAATALGAS